MDSPAPTAPNAGTAPVPAKSRNRFALASFLLSLFPWIVTGLAILASSLFPDVMNHEMAPGLPLFLAIGTGVYLGSHLLFFAALVSGSLGLSRAKRYQGGHAWRGFAIAGLVLAGVGLLALVCLDVVVAYVASACRNSTGC